MRLIVEGHMMRHHSAQSNQSFVWVGWWQMYTNVTTMWWSLDRLKFHVNVFMSAASLAVQASHAPRRFSDLLLAFNLRCSTFWSCRNWTCELSWTSRFLQFHQIGFCLDSRIQLEGSLWHSWNVLQNGMVLRFGINRGTEPCRTTCCNCVHNYTSTVRTCFRTPCQCFHAAFPIAIIQVLDCFGHWGHVFACFAAKSQLGRLFMPSFLVLKAGSTRRQEQQQCTVLANQGFIDVYCKAT